MEQYAQNLVYTDEEKIITYCKNIVKAVKKTRDVATQSKLKSRKIEEALQTKDKQTMWNVLQEYLHKHPELFTMANGVQLRRAYLASMKLKYCFCRRVLFVMIVFILEFNQI